LITDFVQFLITNLIKYLFILPYNYLLLNNKYLSLEKVKNNENSSFSITETIPETTRGKISDNNCLLSVISNYCNNSILGLNARLIKLNMKLFFYITGEFINQYGIDS